MCIILYHYQHYNTSKFAAAGAELGQTIYRNYKWYDLDLLCMHEMMFKKVNVLLFTVPPQLCRGL